MSKCFNGLYSVHLELTNKCNKNCWCCGRRKLDKQYPDIVMRYGDMEWKTLKTIAKQLPDGVIVQFHNNGEGLLYPRFGSAIKLFKRQIRCMDTNGKLLVEKANEIINNLDTMTISVIQPDPKSPFASDKEGDEQYKLVKKFLKIRKNRKPRLIFRCLGDVNLNPWRRLDGTILTRALHDPEGCFEYEKKPVIPETGICLEILNHMAINREGQVSMCVRLDPMRLGILGDCNETPLVDIWNCKQRKEYIKLHIEGKRDKIPFCSYCDYYGVPIGREERE